jgi:hypothetical protein
MTAEARHQVAQNEQSSSKLISSTSHPTHSTRSTNSLNLKKLVTQFYSSFCVAAQTRGFEAGGQSWLAGERRLENVITF